MGGLCSTMVPQVSINKKQQLQKKETLKTSKKGILSPIRTNDKKIKCSTITKFKLDPFELNKIENKKPLRNNSDQKILNKQEKPEFKFRGSKKSLSGTGNKDSQLFILDNQIEDYRDFKLIKKTNELKIYKVKCNITGKDYIMKTVKNLNDNRTYIEEKNGLEISKNLIHPFITQTRASFTEENTLFIVNETSNSGFLIDLINKNYEFNNLKCAMIAFQLLKSILYLNSKKIMHRNINPENIMIVDQNYDLDLIFIKIGDFRKAKIYDPKKKENDYVGKGYFVPPEIIKGSYSEKCDLWTIGIIIYILIEGRAPFIGESESETKEKILNYKPSFSVASPEIKDFLVKILEKDENLRPTALELIEDKWFKIQKIHQIFYTQIKSVNTVFNEKFTVGKNQILKTFFQKYLIENPAYSEQFIEIIRLFNSFDSDHDGLINDKDISSIVKFEYENNLTEIFNCIESKSIDFQKFFCLFVTKKIIDENLEFIYEIASRKLDILKPSDLNKVFKRKYFEKLQKNIEVWVSRNGDKNLNYDGFKFINKLNENDA